VPYIRLQSVIVCLAENCSKVTHNLSSWHLHHPWMSVSVFGPPILYMSANRGKLTSNQWRPWHEFILAVGH
jgi:hypothetical protein